MIAPKALHFSVFIFGVNLFVPALSGYSWPPKEQKCEADFLVKNDEGSRCLENNPNSIQTKLEFEGTELCDLSGKEEIFLEALKTYANNRLKCEGCDLDDINFEQLKLADFTPNPDCFHKPSWPKPSWPTPNGHRGRNLQIRRSFFFTKVLVRFFQRCNRVCSKETLPPFDRRRKLEGEGTLNKSSSLSMENVVDIERIMMKRKDNKEKKLKRKNRRKRRRRRKRDKKKKNHPSWPHPTPKPQTNTPTTKSPCDFTVASVLRDFGFSIETEPITSDEVIECDNRCPVKTYNGAETNTNNENINVCRAPTDSSNVSYDYDPERCYKKASYSFVDVVTVGTPNNQCFDCSGLCCGVPRCDCLK